MAFAADEKAQDLAACQAQLDRVFAAWFKPSAGADRKVPARPCTVLSSDCR